MKLISVHANTFRVRNKFDYQHWMKRFSVWPISVRSSTFVLKAPRLRLTRLQIALLVWLVIFYLFQQLLNFENTIIRLQNQEVAI